MKDSTLLLLAGAGIAGAIIIAFMYKNQTQARLTASQPVVVVQQPQQRYRYTGGSHWNSWGAMPDVEVD